MVLMAMVITWKQQNTENVDNDETNHPLQNKMKLAAACDRQVRQVTYRNPR